MAASTRITEELINEYFSKGYWKNETTSGVWDHHARTIPDREALSDSKYRLTWAQVKDMSDRLAVALLGMGLKRDDPVFLLLPNCVESYVTRIALEKSGLFCITALMTVREYEIEHVLKTYDVVAVFVPTKFRNFDYFEAVNHMRAGLPRLKFIFVMDDSVPAGAVSLTEMMKADLPPRFTDHYFEKTRYRPTDAFTAGLTSGTTGMPKVAEYPICSIMHMGEGYHLMPKLRPDDVVLNVLSAVGGLGRPFCYVAREGARMVVQEVWDAQQALSIMEREKVTVLLSAPAQLSLLIQQSNLGDFNLEPLRAVCCSTSVLGKEAIETAEAKLGANVLNAYGVSDGGIISETTIDDDRETRSCTVGKPFEGTEIRIVDDQGNEVPAGEEGELWFRGPGTSSGFYRDPDLTVKTWGALGKEGWFRTGDLVRIDRRGNLIMTGRKKDVIIRGGQNIYPAEIENLLSLHKAVRQAAIVPMPDPIMGEKACAYVSLNDREEFSFEIMINHLKNWNVAPYKLPERLEIMNELPARGHKVSKVELKEDIIRKLQLEAKGPLNV